MDAVPEAKAAAGGAAQPAGVRVRPARKDRTSLLAATCRVCGLGLGNSSERKLGRHLDCESDYDEATFEALKGWRKTQAEAQKVPAYVVFTDATLIAIAEARPRDSKALGKVQGIGAVKLERYAADVLAIVAGKTPGEARVSSGG